MRRFVWAVLGIVYAAFFVWYTSFGGPLTPEEVEEIVARLEARGMKPERLALFREFLETDTGDDFVMVNVIELREPPIEAEGFGPDATATEVLGRYMEHMWPELLSRACHPVAGGTGAAAALDLWGIDGAERWSQAAFMRYRSRRDLAAIATNPDILGPHEYKLAAMTKTIAFPIDPWFHMGDPRLLLALLFLVLGLALGRRSAR